MESDQLAAVHKVFLGFVQRAEKNSEGLSLFDTFVSTSPLIDYLSNVNNQIIYGRRGTGKTHALKYLQELINQKKSECAIYIDLRSIGSNTSIYSDVERSLTERASLLINDVLQNLSDAFTEIACNIIDRAPHPDQITVRLDDFQNAIGSIKVQGKAEQSTSSETGQDNKREAKAGVELGSSSKLTGEVVEARSDTLKRVKNISHSGREYLHIDFGGLKTALDGLVAVLGLKKVWILLDEWSEIPIGLQPYLADLIRRVILPSDRCIIKIAAIEHRSNFIIKKDKGEYIGFELSADISANLNLDEFLVFDSNKDKSLTFFKSLLFNHYKVLAPQPAAIKSADDLISLVFTQINVFEEFVRAVEGVPRDALNLAATLAKKSFGKKFSMQDVRSAASDWFNTDKSASIRGSGRLSHALNVIVNEVIGNRKARAFLFQNNINHPDIEGLFDARLLHVLKKNISSKDEPGIRYDVLKIDYGCYVDLINTNKEPTLLFEVNDGPQTEVPNDDYRSIRRAILREEMLNDPSPSNAAA